MYPAMTEWNEAAFMALVSVSHTSGLKKLFEMHAMQSESGLKILNPEGTARGG